MQERLRFYNAQLHSAKGKTTTLRKGSQQYLSGCLHQNILQTCYFMDCKNTGGVDITISLMGCLHEDHPRSVDSSTEKSTIHIRDASMHGDVIESLGRVASAMETNGFRPNCRMSELEMGGMISLGITGPNPRPTFLDQ